jgi:NNP family nitrate/nitrite transporter-like MFS transporter
MGGAAVAAEAGGIGDRIVAAAGGLGGYFPPLVMGATYNEVDNHYTVGLLLLVATALVALGYTALKLNAREPVPPDGAGPAR